MELITYAVFTILVSNVYVFETKAFPKTVVSKSTVQQKNPKDFIFPEVTETVGIFCPWRNCHIMNAVLSLQT